MCKFFYVTVRIMFQYCFIMSCYYINIITTKIFFISIIFYEQKKKIHLYWMEQYKYCMLFQLCVSDMAWNSSYIEQHSLVINRVIYLLPYLSIIHIIS